MSGSTRSDSALAARLRPVARTIAWPALLVGALGCVTTVALASRDASPLAAWPGLGAMAMCTGAAFLLDDGAGAAAAATPTSLARRRMLRVALALPLLCGAWVASLWLATANGALFGPDARAGLSLQFAALLTLTLAGSAVALRVMPDGRNGWAGVVAPIILIGMAYYLPQRWTMLAAPGDGAWAASQQRWVALLALAALTLAWASRDPAARAVLRWPRRDAGVDPDTQDGYRPQAR